MYKPRNHDSVADVIWNEGFVSQQMRSELKSHRPLCVWLTGLSGAGKSTLANIVERSLNRQGYHTYLLDGDNVRHGLNKDLGMCPEARKENIRRIAEVAKLMTEAGLIVITAFISPYAEDRQAARALFPEGEFIEVFVDAPLAVCERRDPKGLYKKARNGEIKEFTGIDSEYQVPLVPDVHINTEELSINEAVMIILEAIKLEAC